MLPSAQAPTADDRRRLDPRVRQVWWVSGALVAVPAALLLLIGAAVAAAQDLTWVALGAVVIALVVVGATAVVPPWRYRTWSWALTEEGLEVAHGVLVRTQSAIPTFRVQQVDIAQGPIERAFGVVTLRITTASSGSDGTLPGIDADHAEQVRRMILGRVAADDGV